MRNLVASTLVPTATQETATAKNAQNQSFPNRTSGKDLLKTFSKQKLASKTKFVKQYMTHRKRYLCNRSTRFCQTLIKKGSQYPKQQRYVAKHHDTKAASSLKYGQKLKIATLNCRGLAALSKRQQLTYIMQQHNIDIMAVQETKQAFSPTESHKGYAFFFSGKQANRGPAHYGVGFVISPQIKHCILDCVPVNDRWNWKFQQKDVGTTLWIYMLRTVADRMMKKTTFGIYWTTNVKRMLGAPMLHRWGYESKNSWQTSFWIWHHGAPHFWARRWICTRDARRPTREQTVSNLFFVDCRYNNYIITSTYFSKPPQKQCTFWTPDRFAQLDHILCSKRWKNAIVDRRKFRSQTSDNMDRWKAELGRGREKRRVEERRSEKRKS